jgi:hypothetical protein
MNHSRIIKISNRVALYATIALFYWVIVFLTITVFDLKIFRERITETFFMSVLGIFAILGGALILNVMSNLSKISESVAAKEATIIQPVSSSKWKFVATVLSIPVIIALLFGGAEYSSYKKKGVLISAAKAMVTENQKELEGLANYEFSLEYIVKTGKVISVMEKIDLNLPDAKVILPDAIEGKKVFLAFARNNYLETNSAQKQNFIFTSSKEDRAYLGSVFSNGNTEMRYQAKSGNYELYLPVKAEEKIIVLYFSDYQRYGKIGS